MLRFDEFCEYVKDNARKYMSAGFQKGNYEFRLEEKKDAYDMVTCLLCLEDKQDRTAAVPLFHLGTAYENYKQTGNAEAITAMLAGKYEAAYQAAFQKKEALLPESEVLPGDGELSKVFLISNPENGQADLYQEDVLMEIAAEEGSNLALFPVTEAAVLAVPVKSRKEYQECVDCISVMQKDDPDMEQTAADSRGKLYDKESNTVRETGEEIEAVLQRVEREQGSKKRSVFSREKK